METNKQTHSKLTDDSEMLDEYDFSQGERGKYFQKYQNNNLTTLTGIQFLIDSKGRKTGVLIDIQKHHQLWLNTLEENQDNSNTFYFLIDENGRMNFEIFLSTRRIQKVKDAALPPLPPLLCVLCASAVKKIRVIKENSRITPILLLSHWKNSDGGRGEAFREKADV